MRASTLFGLAIALFLGVAAVVGIRVSGILDKTPLAPDKVEPPIMVLVAKRNLYEGTASTSTDVGVRPASKAEIENALLRGPLMPPSPEAAHLRIPSRSIAVDEILCRDDFSKQVVPDSVTSPSRMDPGMRSVNLVLPKDRAAGGLLRVGEYVDVYFTTMICADPKCSSARMATAPLATNLKVIVKRDNLWTVMQAPEERPSYILQANAYRAALIEFAKSRGMITLIPSGPAPKDRDRGGVASYAKLEDSKAQSFLRGEEVVSDIDLERIFNLAPIPSAEPPLAVEHYKGIQYAGTTVHNRQNGFTMPQNPTNYGFYAPGAAPARGGSSPIIQSSYPTGTEATPECPTCGKK